jgi:transposase InsO family protein
MSNDGPFQEVGRGTTSHTYCSPLASSGYRFVKMPQSNQGNNYILTVVDYFAKWPEATTLPDKRARTVSSTLYKIFLHMGFPAVVSSDQGREFVNGVLDTLQQKSKTEQRVSSAYHPEINGLVERFNQTLQNMLAKVCPDENDWDLYLDEVTFSKACKR